MLALFYLCLFFLLSIWVLYPLIIFFLNALKPRNEKIVVATSSLSVTVIIAAHNEADNLVARVENIYAGDYPDQLIEVVVASDGSTDNTHDVVEEIKKRFPAVKLIEIMPQQGRSNAHNVAVADSSGEILIFTDAESEFERGFINEIIAPFSDQRVGYTSGVLLFQNTGTSKITESLGFYWKFERMLRCLESSLGIYVFGSGACCAVRKELFRDIPPTGDVDFTTPLDVVLQGYKCIHVNNALNYEILPDTPEREFRARVRMTTKNLYGTVTRWGVSGFISHPIYSLVIVFHKIGRWLTPFCMIAIYVSNAFLVNEGIWYQLFFAGQSLFYVLAICGFLKVPIPMAGQIYSFCFANAGFLVGVLNAFIGKIPHAYKPASKS